MATEASKLFVLCECSARKNILTQICGNNFLVLKAAPPLVVTPDQLNEYVAAIRGVMELAHTSASFWSEALGLARRAAKI